MLFPVNLSLSISLSDPARDPKRVKKILFLLCKTIKPREANLKIHLHCSVITMLTILGIWLKEFERIFLSTCLIGHNTSAPGAYSSLLLTKVQMIRLNIKIIRMFHPKILPTESPSGCFIQVNDYYFWQ